MPMAAFAVPAGIECAGPPVAFDPSYLRAARGLDAGMPETPFVMYGVGADDRRSRAPRCWPRSCRSVLQPHLRAFLARTSTRRTIRSAARSAPAVTLHGSVAYVAYPIFEMYHAMGQPLYK